MSENVSLSELYPKEKLGNILTPRGQWRPFAGAKDRAPWVSITEPIRHKFISLGEEYLGKDVPSLPATLYLEYRRIGNRSNYQNVWHKRRKMLHCLVLAECMEGKGRFLDSIANVIWAICEESSWTYPAHVGAQEAGVKTWIREVGLIRGATVRVLDSFELEQASRDIVQSLITPCEIIRSEPGKLILKDSQTRTELTVRYDSDSLTVETETIPMDDGRLAQMWGSHLNRILLKTKSPIIRGYWTMRFSK